MAITHPDGTPYWTPDAPSGSDARAEADYIASTGILYSKGGSYLTSGTLTECAAEFEGIVINYQEDYN